MQRSLIRRANYGLESEGVRGVHPWRQRPDYKTFQSRFGPQIKKGSHIYGINGSKAANLATLGAGFGVAAGIFAIFFLDAVPRLQRDVLQKLPIIGGYFVHEVPPEDNPF